VFPLPRNRFRTRRIPDVITGVQGFPRDDLFNGSKRSTFCSYSSGRDVEHNLFYCKRNRDRLESLGRLYTKPLHTCAHIRDTTSETLPASQKSTSAASIYVCIYVSLFARCSLLTRPSFCKFVSSITSNCFFSPQVDKLNTTHILRQCLSLLLRTKKRPFRVVGRRKFTGDTVPHHPGKILTVGQSRAMSVFDMLDGKASASATSISLTRHL
jgi:hypothetical protein